jgi:DNA-binding NarL/FixJ family response regulator
MFNIIYLEEKLLDRQSFQLVIEKQQDCKVLFSSGNVDQFCLLLKSHPLVADACILSDDYNYYQMASIIKAVKDRSPHTYILVKSNQKYMKALCYLMRHGLNGFFFTDEPMIDIKQVVWKRTKYHINHDKDKFITNNTSGDINIHSIKYHKTKLTENEIAFIQACTLDYSYEEIATVLKKSVNTIYGYRDRVFRKLQVKQRTAMVVAALQQNYIDL